MALLEADSTLVSYCCITYYCKLSGFKQHSLIVSQFCRSDIQTHVTGSSAESLTSVKSRYQPVHDPYPSSQVSTFFMFIVWGCSWLLWVACCHMPIWPSLQYSNLLLHVQQKSVSLTLNLGLQEGSSPSKVLPWLSQAHQG